MSRHTLFVRIFSILGLLALALLLGHFAEGHHGDPGQDCPLCLLALSLFLISLTLLLHHLSEQRETLRETPSSFAWTCVPVTAGRDPPSQTAP